MNRFDRVSAIMIMLQTKRYITAGELAKRFDVTKRTIYRDLSTLEQAGIPLGAEPGKGYYLTEGYHLPPVMFTADEAAALLMAGKMVDKLSDESVRASFKMAFDKVRAVLPGRDKTMVEALDSSIEVYHRPESAMHGCSNKFLTDIHKALASRQVIEMGYYSFSRDEVVESRQVEPIGICFYSLHWHLIGWCRKRNDYRDFRVDRIMSLVVTDQTFKARPIQSLQAYFAAMRQKEAIFKAEITVDVRTAHLMESSRYFYGFLESKHDPDGVTCYFVTPDYNYLARWLMMFADGLVKVSPLELQIEVKRLKDSCCI
jgi:predicted DNA-binding transcriptional regulator YafY